MVAPVVEHHGIIDPHSAGVVARQHQRVFARRWHTQVARVANGEIICSQEIGVWRAIAPIEIKAVNVVAHQWHTAKVGIVEIFSLQAGRSAATVAVEVCARLLVVDSVPLDVYILHHHLQSASDRGAVERSHFRTTAATWNLIGKRTYHHHRFSIRDRQEAALVFEQYNALLCHLLRHGAIIFVLRRFMLGSGVLIRLKTINHAQNMAHLFVNHLQGDALVAQHGLQAVAIEVFRLILTVHIQIQAATHGTTCAVCGAPVAHHHAFKAPHVAEHLVVEPRVFGGIEAIHQIVGIHHGCHISIFHRRTKRGEIDFVASALVGTRVNALTPPLHIIEGKVLHHGCHAILLQPLDKRHSHLRREIGIFAKVFKISAAHR